MQEVHHQLPLARPQLGTWPATRHVLWLGIEPVTFHFTGRHSIHWATPVRAFFNCNIPSLLLLKIMNIAGTLHLLVLSLYTSLCTQLDPYTRKRTHTGMWTHHTQRILFGRNGSNTFWAEVGTHHSTNTGGRVTPGTFPLCSNHEWRPFGQGFIKNLCKS